jgi:hypothetical protein
MRGTTKRPGRPATASTGRGLQQTRSGLQAGELFPHREQQLYRCRDISRVSGYSALKVRDDRGSHRRRRYGEHERSHRNRTVTSNKLRDPVLARASRATMITSV